MNIVKSQTDLIYCPVPMKNQYENITAVKRSSAGFISQHETENLTQSLRTHTHTNQQMNFSFTRSNFKLTAVHIWRYVQTINK